MLKSEARVNLAHGEQVEVSGPRYSSSLSSGGSKGTGEFRAF
ncbi:MAG: hypothetical protein ACOYKZ_01460 [Chlamydiia bacterium]